ncbi:hypothetical protein WR25_23548 [Diploscapter pachys]|uniref:Uncharacterized protein n=1 Tax=Diploscapter pachys TaxID=2018661 RepID=A0A2A2LIA1_9BILA|nr:hypothetical protein WR25_23548 [Diploscapter pachys]
MKLVFRGIHCILFTLLLFLNTVSCDNDTYVIDKSKPYADPCATMQGVDAMMCKQIRKWDDDVKLSQSFVTPSIYDLELELVYTSIEVFFLFLVSNYSTL